VTRQDLSPPAPGGEQQYLTALELVPNASSRGGTTAASADGTTTGSTTGGASATDASESEIETAKLRAALAVSALFKRGLLAADAQPLLLVSATGSGANNSSSIVEDDSAKHTSAAAALSLQVRGESL
jgi:hypothetical protein